MLRKLVLAVGATAGLLVPNEWTSRAAAGPDIALGISVGNPRLTAGYHPWPGWYPPPRLYPPVYPPPRLYPPVYPPPSYYPPIGYPGPGFLRPYQVLYRTCSHEPWRVYGTYWSHRQAHEVACFLERSGYQAYVHHP